MRASTHPVQRVLVALLALLLTPLVLAPGASADSRSATDRRGDAPAGVDIRAWRIDYGERNVVATMRVRGLAPRDYQRFSVVLPSMSGPEGPDEHVVLNVGAGGARSVDYWYVRETEVQQGCRGMRASISHAKNRVRLVMPRRCLLLGGGDWDRRRFRVTARSYTAEDYQDGYLYGSSSARDTTSRVTVTAG